MKTLHLAIIMTIGIVIVVSSFNNTLAQNMTNSSNPISPIPLTILNSAVPTLTPSESQAVINVALTIPELQNWSHDWHYADMGFLGNNKLAIAGFEWQYAMVYLKAPSASAPVPCDNDWWAWVEVDMTTMKVVQATYPTRESHSCQVAMGGGPGTLGVKLSSSTTSITSPLKQYKSGTPAQEVKCNNNFVLVIKWEDSSPACITPLDAKVLYEHGWTWSAIPDKSLGMMVKVLYGTNGFMSCLDNCTKHFSLNIKTTSKSYLLGYEICDGNSCTKDSLQSHQTPNLQNNFLTVPLPDELNSKWKVGDVVDIKVLISPIFGNSNSTLFDLGNSTILATELVGI